jgi:hypothetical protein
VEEPVVTVVPPKTPTPEPPKTPTPEPSEEEIEEVIVEPFAKAAPAAAHVVPPPPPPPPPEPEEQSVGVFEPPPESEDEEEFVEQQLSRMLHRKQTHYLRNTGPELSPEQVHDNYIGRLTIEEERKSTARLSSPLRIDPN